MTQPSISVVIPTYNRGVAAKATIDSALSQDLGPDEVEVLVVDDGSTDDTFAWLQARYGHNARVRLFRINNGGVARARNFGLAQARGEFIAFLDHDDLWLPQKLRLQRQKMTDPRVAVVYCNWKHFDHQGFLSPDDSRVVKPYFGLEPNKFAEKMLSGNFIVSMSIPLIRTSSLRAIGGFDPNTVPCDDWDVWIRLTKRNQFVGIEEELVWYHQHANQISFNRKIMIAADKRTRRKNRHLMWRHPHIMVLTYKPTSIILSNTVYHQVKAVVFENQWGKAWRMTLGCLARRPLLIFTPHWIYLLNRMIRRNSQRY